MYKTRGRAVEGRVFPVCISHSMCYPAGSIGLRINTFRTGWIVFMGTDVTPDFDRLGSLARKAQAGDGAAYESLLEQLYTHVRYVLMARLGHFSDLDDLTQICLLAMHRALPSYHPSRNLRPWVNAIIRYKIADYFRDLARQREFAQTEDMLEVANQAQVTEAAGSGLSEQVHIHELLKQLPETWAKAVQLTKFDGLSCEAAAEQQGVSAAALRKRISRAYKKLAKLIEQEREA